MFAKRLGTSSGNRLRSNCSAFRTGSIDFAMVLYHIYTAGLNIIGLILVLWAARRTFAQTTISDCSSFRKRVTASAYNKTTITSPNYPWNYDNNLECAWVIEVDRILPNLGYGYVVKVTFNDFKLEKSSYKCTDDVLKFYDGLSSTSRLLGAYCDSRRPGVIYSSWQYLYVKFHTDAYFTEKGFSFSFSAVKAEEASGICRSTDGSNKVHSLTGTSGTFFSPDYPVPYPDDARCIWTISVPAGKRVKLTFEDFNLDRGLNVTCDINTDNRDYVQMRDGQVSKSKELALYCGYQVSSNEAKDVYSTGRYMWVKFHSSSGSSQMYRGFKARFDAVDLPPSSNKQMCSPGNIYNNNLTLTGSSGTLQSPTDNDRKDYYPSDSSCDWLITVPDGKVVKLSFDQSFALEPSYGSTCTADYVEVLDGKNNSESKGRYCGFTTPEDIHSSGRYMWVRFRSDSTSSYYDGFKATFAAVDKSSSDTIAIAVVTSGAVFIVLVCCIVCIVRYKRKKSSGAAGVTMPMSTTTTSASYPTQPAGVIQYPPPPPPQAPYQPLANPYPPPQVGYAPVPTNPPVGYGPVPTNPPVPPPGYQYSMQPPPPYPEEEAVPQYPPPGQPYAWQQSAPVKASAPPQSP